MIEQIIVKLLSALPANWGLIVAAFILLIDICAKIWPTLKDYSIINFIIGLYDDLIPNLKKGGGQIVYKSETHPDEIPRIVERIKKPFKTKENV